MNNDSISEKNSVGITISGMNFMILPVLPAVKIIGAKAAIEVATANVTGLAISIAPAIAPLSPGVPRSWCAWMFSPIRIASSTTIPNTTMKANSEIMLIETSSVGISQNVPRNEIGMPRLTQKARRNRRNNASTRNTRPKPVSPLRIIRSRRPRRYVESSCQVVNSMPSGKRCLEPSMYSWTVSEMAIALSSPTRNTFTSAHGLPSKYDSWSSSSKPSWIVATWPSRSRVPSGRDRSVICSKSTACLACPLVRSRISPPRSALIVPPGRSMEDSLTARATSSNVRLYRRSAVSETSIDTSRSRTLASSTCVMPASAINSSRTCEA